MIHFLSSYSSSWFKRYSQTIVTQQKDFGQIRVSSHFKDSAFSQYYCLALVLEFAFIFLVGVSQLYTEALAAHVCSCVLVHKN